MAGPDAASSSTATEQKHDQNGANGSNGAAPVAAEPAAPPKKKMKRSSRIALIIIGIIALLAALGFGGAYFLYSSKFVTTDNAQVDGDKISINAPMTGTLTSWSINQGSSVKENQAVGRIQVQGSMQSQKIIKAPGNGTVAVNNGVEGSFVTAGKELATAYDFSKIYVTARVDETDVQDVHPGAQVDVSVDAFSSTPVTGVVQEIQGSAAGVFSLFPESNSSGNFQKVTQVIPIKIAFTNTNGLALVPGMNVTVHIHKNP
ncbi:HlyD family efflux transporter periplasmic adaptor subunit [Pseudonocardia spinosispora]|uniref:HlyD family efflux transporter periplasmic adaptor subunit n=1 Tax=Pseudonocardia spinosispora TaxID=103441 RepID=UPI0003F50B9D|nr:HlyD family efflux transporter periplasmic adaptor subunit [Pseudonocardia spinosispora]